MFKAITDKAKAQKSLLKKLSLSAVLLLGTTLSGSYWIREKSNPEKFPVDSLVVANKLFSQKDFYEGLEKHDGVWYFNNPAFDKPVNLYEQTDFTFAAEEKHRSFRNVQPVIKYDTVHVSVNPSNKDIFYSYGTLEGLKNMPAFGQSDWNVIRIRHFLSSDAALNEAYKVYNDEYNCTLAHEYRHFLNKKAGIMKGGQSYETKFSEVCMDEVSANIAQLLEQRKNYLETGDIRHITPRFNFYKKWVLAQKSPLSENVSPEEADFMANSMLDVWKKTKFKMYLQNTVSLTIHYMAKTNCNGCKDRPEIHHQLMHRMFYINDIDFYQYIAGREKEFVDSLPSEKKQLFEQKRLSKKKQYMQKVEEFTQNDNERKDAYFSALKNRYAHSHYKTNAFKSSENGI